jgi:hypothetical protein
VPVTRPTGRRLHGRGPTSSGAFVGIVAASGGLSRTIVFLLERSESLRISARDRSCSDKKRSVPARAHARPRSVPSTLTLKEWTMNGKRVPHAVLASRVSPALAAWLFAAACSPPDSAMNQQPQAGAGGASGTSPGGGGGQDAAGVSGSTTSGGLGGGRGIAAEWRCVVPRGPKRCELGRRQFRFRRQSRWRWKGR